MSLFANIKAARIIAYKEKDNIAKDILGVLIAEASKVDKEPGDDHVITVAKKMVDNNAETIALLHKQDNYDADKIIELELQVDVLKKFIPKQMSEDAIAAAIKHAITLDFKDMGAIMRYLKENFKGRYDGSIASRLVKEALK